MPPGQERRSALGWAVVAIALLLAAFLGRELWKRRGASLPGGVPMGVVPGRGEAAPAPKAAPDVEGGPRWVSPAKAERPKPRKPRAVPAPR